ncbi:hypothetical protein BDN67DRAFT_1016075 [Paxillus ammoniavirescens]|nr:hypothetical protein BDN67DRAFT_1016075 [Paxillus ammoniavirescens]
MTSDPPQDEQPPPQDKQAPPVNQQDPPDSPLCPPSPHPGVPLAQHDHGLLDLDLQELTHITQLDFLRRDLSFIQSVRNASLDDEGTGLTHETLQQLRNPPKFTPEIEDPYLELALTMLLVLKHSSQETYEKTRLTIQKCHPGSEVPSFYHVKTALADIIGIKAMIHHMCLNSCLAYIGPYTDYKMCLNCGEFRFDQIKL